MANWTFLTDQRSLRPGLQYLGAQQEVAQLAQTALEFPPLQKGASFNLSVVKEKVEKAMANRAGN